MFLRIQGYILIFLIVHNTIYTIKQSLVRDFKTVDICYIKNMLV